MDELKIITTDLKSPIEKTERAIRESIQQHGRVSVYGFTSLEEAEAIVTIMPKYVKAIASPLLASSSFKQYGVYSEETTNYSTHDNHAAYGITLTIELPNKVTGSLNELGEKRLTAFIKALKQHGIIEGKTSEELQDIKDNSWVRVICSHCDGDGCEHCDTRGHIYRLPDGWENGG